MPDTLPAPVSAPAALPHNLAAEFGVLGALLYDNALYWRVFEFLRPDDFYAPAHQRIYAKLEEAIRQSTTADDVTLLDAFENDPDLGAAGGPAYLTRLMAQAAFGPEVVDYARLVHDLALRRNLIDLGGTLTSRARRSEGDLIGVKLIEEAEKVLAQLAERDSTGRGWIDFGKAATGAVEAAQIAMKREGKISGIATGLTLLDMKLGGLHKSDLLILAGRPSMGKTALATNIAFNAARRWRADDGPDGHKRSKEGAIVGFFSLEMSSEQLAARVLADAARVPSDEMRKGEITPQSYARLRDAMIELRQIPLFIDETGGISISQLVARARRLKRERGLDLLIVDYLQLVTGSGSRKSDNRVNEVSEVTQGLKALAKELSIPVIALSQLSRQVESRDDKRPQLSDLRESGSIEQDADVVMFVFREEYYIERQKPSEPSDTADGESRMKYETWRQRFESSVGKAEVIIGKQRHGPVGTIELAFDAKHTRFYDLETRYSDSDRRD
jgi:replicative DNA helicase